MNKDELIKELERLKDEYKKYSNNTSMNAGYRVAIMDTIDLVKKLTLTDFVVELPSVKSKEFQRWTQSKGYEPAFDRLWYEKNSQTYNTELLYRAFTNEIALATIKITI
jgi:hypothetical protein